MPAIVLTAPLQGWVTALEDVPDPVFAERMLGDGVAIDPVGDCLVSPCAGTVLSVQPTGHALTIETAEGAQVLIHIGLDTVALGGRGFTPLVQAGKVVTPGEPLIRFDLDLLVREARAIVTPVLAIGEDWRVTERAGPGPIAPGEPLMTLVPNNAGTTEPARGEGERHERTLTIALPHGIHARPAARIAAFAREQRAALTLAKGGRSAPAASPTGLLTLGISNGDGVIVSAQGDDAAGAVAGLVALIEGGLGEHQAFPVPAPAPVAPAAAQDGNVPTGALAGVTAAPGLVVGNVRRHHVGDAELPKQGAGIAQEEAAFAAALRELADDLTARALTAAGPARAIMEAHRALLDDPALLDATRAEIARGHGAGHAWRAAIRPLADALRAGSDARLAERAGDMLDLERQLIARLTGAVAAAIYPPGTVLVAEDLLPSDLMGLDASTLAGLAVERGGPTSHVAILAASLDLPALVAIGPALREVADDTPVILDANGGFLLPDPAPDRLAAAQEAVAAAAQWRADALARAGVACRTSDGERIELFANLGSVADAQAAVARGAEGCGLLRTEFLFLDRDAMPGVGEQAAEYQRIADALDGRPLIVRLLDIGGDKPAPYLPFPAEENPALGLRGIRVALTHPAVLEDQLRAILSVRPVGQCRIMLPMIAGLDELRAVRTVLDRLRGELGVTEPVKLGIMVETPAAAITADLLAAEADFLSVGTNDLTQYVLAMDRGNAAVAAAIDGLHPAVLRLIGETCRGARQHGRWTGVCGGLASDSLAVPILIGLGVTELSAAPGRVPEIKALVAGLTIQACRVHAAAALRCATAAEVRMLARRFEKEEARA